MKAQITISNQVTCSNLPESLKSAVCDRLTFRNPKYIENQRQGRWNGKIEQWLKFYQLNNGSLILPRGFAGQLLSMAHKHRAIYQLVDQRREQAPVPFEFFWYTETLPGHRGHCHA